MDSAMIEDIVFAINESRTLVPYAEVVKQNGLTGFVRIANVSTLLKNDIRVGDYVDLSEGSRIRKVLRSKRPVDAHPVGIPLRCPSCDQHLVFRRTRVLTVHCENINCLEGTVTYAS